MGLNPLHMLPDMMKDMKNMNDSLTEELGAIRSLLERLVEIEEVRYKNERGGI